MAEVDGVHLDLLHKNALWLSIKEVQKWFAARVECESFLQSKCMTN